MNFSTYNLTPTLINLKASSDNRGTFTKIYSMTSEERENFWGLGIQFETLECYYSVSHAGVLRGMHFQTPPHDHHKIVHVLQGEILDVVVDLRRKSSTFKQCFQFDLNGIHKSALFIPKGFAHGFLAKTEAHVQYFQTTTYAPNHDHGIHYQSLGFNWGIETPIVSTRDQNFPFLNDFQSPFDF